MNKEDWELGNRIQNLGFGNRESGRVILCCDKNCKVYVIYYHK